jgi:hypothetical protein
MDTRMARLGLRPGNFLCGCVGERPQDVALNPKTFDTVEFDNEGYLICKAHRARLYGWRLEWVVQPLGTPLDIEPPQRDRRDTRDAERLGNELLAEREFRSDGTLSDLYDSLYGVP